MGNGIKFKGEEFLALNLRDSMVSFLMGILSGDESTFNYLKSKGIPETRYSRVLSLAGMYMSDYIEVHPLTISNDSLSSFLNDAIEFGIRHLNDELFFITSVTEVK